MSAEPGSNRSFFRRKRTTWMIGGFLKCAGDVRFEVPVVYNLAMAHSPEQQRSSAARFATTHWSIVLAAGRTSSPDSRRALTRLCETYWYPTYAYVRRRGHSREKAQDLTQEFFLRLLEKDVLQAADPMRGKFRSFLLASFNNFLANERRDARARKRGGGHVHLSLDFQSAEDRYQFEPVDQLTPERIYERRWAMTLLERALSRLRSEHVRVGKCDHFDELKVFLGGEGQRVSYKEIAEKLAMTEGAVKVSVHRLRRRCRELLRAEIAQTVAGPEEVDEELRYLFSALEN